MTAAGRGQALDQHKAGCPREGSWSTDEWQTAWCRDCGVQVTSLTPEQVAAWKRRWAVSDDARSQS